MPSPPQSGLVPLNRRDAFAAVLLSAALIACAVFRLHPDVCGQCHDDALYVLTAKALAEGEGYRLTNLPGNPPQTKYPPLYPVLLAALWKLWPDFPANLVLLQSVSVLCGAAFLSAFYLYLVRFGYASRGIALAAGLLCALNMSFVFMAVVTMAEHLFGVLMVAMLWWLERAVRDPEPHPRADFLGGVLLALPFLCRSVGLLFLPLGLLKLWQTGKRWRWATVGATLATLPWISWSLLAANACRNDPVQGYYTDYVGWWASFGLPALAQVVTHNFLWVLTSAGGPLLDGFTLPLLRDKQFQLWAVLSFPAGLLTLAGILYDLRRGRLLPTVLAAYLVLVCVWPWTPHRFLIPVLPFLTAYLLRALQLPGRLTALRRAWPVVAALVLGAALGLTGAERYRLGRLRHLHDTPTPEQDEQRHAWFSTQRLLDWLVSHSDRHDVIAAGADSTVSLYTGRKSYYPIVCPPLSLFYGYEYPREQVLAGSLHGFEKYRPRYLVLTANFHGDDLFRAWVALVQERHPGMLVPVYEDEADDRFTIFEIRYFPPPAIQP